MGEIKFSAMLNYYSERLVNKMKKVLSIILTLAALIIFLITFSACNIIAPEHTHSLTQVAKKEATCTEDGVGAYYACSKCDKIFADAEGKNEMETPEVIFATSRWLIRELLPHVLSRVLPMASIVRFAAELSLQEILLTL